MLLLSRLRVVTTRLRDPNQCLGTDVICALLHSTLMVLRSCRHEQPTGSGSLQWSTSSSWVRSVGDGPTTDVVCVSTNEDNLPTSADRNKYLIAIAPSTTVRRSTKFTANIRNEVFENCLQARRQLKDQKSRGLSFDVLASSFNLIN